MSKPTLVADLTPIDQALQHPDDLPVLSYDTHQVAVMIGWIPKGTPRGTREAKLGAERVRKNLIKTGVVKARFAGGEWRVCTPSLIEYFTGWDDPSVAQAAS